MKSMVSGWPQLRLRDSRMACQAGPSSASFLPSSANNGDRTGAPWGNNGGWADGTTGAWPDWIQVTFAAFEQIEQALQQIGQADVARRREASVGDLRVTAARSAGVDEAEVDATDIAAVGGEVQLYDAVKEDFIGRNGHRRDKRLDVPCFVADATPPPRLQTRTARSIFFSCCSP